MKTINSSMDEIEQSIMDKEVFSYLNNLSLRKRGRKFKETEFNWLLDCYNHLCCDLESYMARYYAIKKTREKFLEDEYERRC